VRQVVLVPHGFQPEYETGFANGLARNGFAVTLIGSDMSLPSRLDAGVRLVNLRGSQDDRRASWRKGLNLGRYWLRYLLFLWRRRGTPVHLIGDFTTADLGISLLEARLTRLVAGRYALTVHNPTRDKPEDGDAGRQRQLARRRAIYDTAEILVVHTPRMREALVDRFGVDPARVVVVEHGIDRVLPPDPVTRSAMRARLGIGADERTVLFFGNLGWYKGVDLLLDAFERLADRSPLHLVLAGRCVDADLRTDLTDRIASSQWRDAIHWLDGYLPDDDVPALFHAGDVLVMPYRAIDQSGVVFMALATGLPVVASDVGSLRDYVTRERGVVVPPSDVEAIVEAVGEVLRRGKPDAAELREDASALLWASTVQAVFPAYERLAAAR